MTNADKDTIRDIVRQELLQATEERLRTMVREELEAAKQLVMDHTDREDLRRAVRDAIRDATRDAAELAADQVTMSLDRSTRALSDVQQLLTSAPERVHEAIRTAILAVPQAVHVAAPAIVPAPTFVPATSPTQLVVPNVRATMSPDGTVVAPPQGQRIVYTTQGPVYEQG